MREAEATNQDAERKNEQLQAQLVRQKEKADKAEAQVAELKTDNRTWLEMFGMSWRVLSSNPCCVVPLCSKD